MKNTQKITRVQLKTNHKLEFILLGIVSSEPDYKLSLILNKQFNISLKSLAPVKITDENGLDYEFSRFSDTSYSPEIIINLISNRSGKNFLLKKLKNIDYLFQVQDPSDSDRFTSTLREIEAITAVFNIDLDLIREKNLGYLIQ